MTAPVDVLAVLRPYAQDTGAFRVNNEGATELATACAAVEELIAERDALLAERATMKEEWFLCHHPAWPDPLRCRDRNDAIRSIKEYPHPSAWLLRVLSGGRVEYKGDELAALAKCGGGK